MNKGKNPSLSPVNILSQSVSKNKEIALDEGGKTMRYYTVTVFGAEEKCASCIHLPSAKETFEWLEAAIKRKYPDHPITFEYVDIDKPHQEEQHKAFVQAIQADEYFYPLVVINGEVVAEGNPNLKEIFARIASKGND